MDNNKKKFYLFNAYVGSYDAKNKINRCDKVVTVEQLRKIERGCSIEDLDALVEQGFKIFKYKTQLTIHGLFPELSTSRIGSYKNVFKNENGSLGVKWSAVDVDKRHKLADMLKHGANWLVHENSSEFVLYKCQYLPEDKEDRLKIVESYISDAKRICSGGDLFFGSVKAYTTPATICSRPSIFLDLYISSFYKKNFEKLVELITGNEFKDCKAKYSQYLIKLSKERAEFERKYAAKKKEEEYAKKELTKKLQQGYEEVKNPTIKAGDIFLEISGYTTPIIRGIKVLKYGKKFKIVRYNHKTGETAKHGIINSTGNILGVYYKYNATTKPKIEQDAEKPITTTNGVKVIQYSTKAIAVIGDTKPIKDKLKKLGGRFNFRLKCGAGWIFPKTMEKEVISTLGIAE